MDGSKPQQIPGVTVEAVTPDNVVPLGPHQEYLTKQGITAEEAAQMDLKFLSAKEASEALEFRVREPGILIPFPDSSHFRVRMLPGKGKAKYLQKRGTGHGDLYLSEGREWKRIKCDTSQAVFVTEGEFKAWRGSKEFPTIGIGGVDMQAPLWTSGFEWNRRTVYVVFDKDRGQEAGTYKPAVGRSLGKLCAELIRRGATVWVLNIPGDADAKVGLDDYLLGGGTMAKLVSDYASKPPEWMAELAGLLEECVYITGTDSTHIFNKRNKSRKSVDDFHAAHIRKVIVDDEGKVKQVSRLWQRHPDRDEAESYTLMPDREYCEIVTNDGVPKLNLWTPFPLLGLPDPTIPGEWERFVKGLFGEETVTFAGREMPMWKWVCLWTAHMLARPWEQTNQGVLVVTKVVGIGKSLYGEIVGQLIGRDHYLECRSDKMLDKFNPEMEGKTWVMVNELDAKFRMSVGQLNDLFSAEWMTIEHKGRNKYQLENYRRWYLTTNASSPCRLAPGQRRILVLCPPLVDSDTRGEWGQWVRGAVAGWKRSDAALGAIREWFYDLWETFHEDGGVWDPTEPVPLTQASEEIAEGSLSNNETIAASLCQWILDSKDKFVVIRPEYKQTRKVVFNELAALVRAEGGGVHIKGIREGEKTVWHTVYEFDEVYKRDAKTNAKREVISQRDAEAARAMSATFTAVVRSTIDTIEDVRPAKFDRPNGP